MIESFPESKEFTTSLHSILFPNKIIEISSSSYPNASWYKLGLLQELLTIYIYNYERIIKNIESS